MNQNPEAPSKLKVILTWIAILVFVIGSGVFALMQAKPGSVPGKDKGETVHAVVWLIGGGFLLVLGLAGYFACVYTSCLTFDFHAPVWAGIKGKMFVANIFIPLAMSMGIGFGLSPFVSPAIEGFGVEAATAQMASVIGSVVLFSIAQMWFLIWAPLEKRMIIKRLLKRGITQEQLRTGFLIGLSDPASRGMKRFGAIEEDMGALWITPEQLIYWGDAEQFAVRREQVVAIERKADARSTTMLAGIAHVILHVHGLGPAVRIIRLHTEGHLTMGSKKRAMERLAEALSAWQGSYAATPPAVPL